MAEKTETLIKGTSESTTNAQKIRLHSTIELDLLECEERLVSTQNEREKVELEKLKSDLSKISQSLKLNYAKSELSSYRIVDRVDEMLRICCVLLFLVSTSVYVALPCLLMKPIERMLVEFRVLTPAILPTVYLRRFTSWGLVTLSGIHVEVQGREHCTFGYETHLKCFSHVSTLDAFLTAMSINALLVSFMKYELLFVPFFSWHALAFGAIPLNRRKREQAVAAMADGVSRASAMDVVAVAPEGTRSTTGLLLPFKKGPFHVWQQLNCAPIAPVVNFGAFELYPPHRLFCMPGNVCLRFLPVIRTSEADKERICAMTPEQAHAAREKMSNRLRRDMLLSMQNVPEAAGTPLSAAQRAVNITAMIVCLLWHYYLWKIIPFRAIKRSFGLTRLHVYLLAIFGSVAMSVSVYVYLYYVVHWIARAYRMVVPRKKRSWVSARSSREDNVNSMTADGNSNGSTSRANDKKQVSSAAKKKRR